MLVVRVFLVEEMDVVSELLLVLDRRYSKVRFLFHERRSRGLPNLV